MHACMCGMGGVKEATPSQHRPGTMNREKGAGWVGAQLKLNPPPPISRVGYGHLPSVLGRLLVLHLPTNGRFRARPLEVAGVGRRGYGWRGQVGLWLAWVGRLPPLPSARGHARTRSSSASSLSCWVLETSACAGRGGFVTTRGEGRHAHTPARARRGPHCPGSSLSLQPSALLVTSDSPDNSGYLSLIPLPPPPP